jgi:hypothetical protein
MSTSDQTQCLGLFGKFFGHKYRARYSTKSIPHFGGAQAELAKRQDLKDLIMEAKRDISDDSEIVEALDRLLSDSVHNEEERVYHCDICVRCGHLVARPGSS